ncbi:PREDICTED: B3 domain-containing protein Os03g0622200-like isoform X2 [Nelumbo nucifera]|uniref:B3 domain-containing protein Os03g0622200-like isoform X2 n=2 Tax=Nelumbo nucifera TaxID=4432 RepID=A0A1U7ZNZ0_NELNU|nr:PREDICTED: B3 domain-containing protein Os03g0622200-like isoform X2 [Nelumbo nucifera]DAD40568.1 TPA_asm: hypothetical protein HUJ06_014891 [Nelumbo nucifera]
MVQARRRAFNHDKSPHFFKVFFPDQSSERLRVPPPFIKHFNGVIPERVILRSRIGRFWSVEMAQDEDNWFFQDGWKEFVQDNSLRSGYFLVFRYNYNSSFDVLIFDSTSCEKEEFSTCTNGGRRKAEEAKEDLNKNTSSLKRVYFVRNPQEVRRKKCGCTQSKRAVAVEAEEERVPKAEKLVKPKEKIVTKANKLDKPKNPQFTACFSMLMAHLLAKRPFGRVSALADFSIQRS